MKKHRFNFFEKFWDYIRLVKNSPYKKLNQKLRAFWILLVLYIKYKLNPRPEKEITFKIFQYHVTAYRYSTLLFLFKEIFLKGDYYFEAVDSRLKIIDCGANIGMSVLYFKHLFPNSSILAFEPNPFAFALLEKNVSQNNLKNVILKNVGLSNEKGTTDFYFLPKDKESLKGSIHKTRDEGNTLKIKTEKLSEYMTNDNYDLIKIDIEGAEEDVLIDLIEAGVLKHGSKYIIEYHHKMKDVVSKLSHFLKPFEDQGYEYNLKTTFKGQGQFQDILIYIYK